MKNHFLESLEIESEVIKRYMDYAKTAVLESDTILTKQGAKKNEIIIPKITMNGLGVYHNGYPQIGVSMTWQSIKFNYNSRWKFSINAMNNEATLRLTLGQLIDEVVRTNAIPEQDAFRFARYANLTGSKISGNLFTGAEVLETLQIAIIKMDNADIPSENRNLFITSDLLIKIQNVDITKRRPILGVFTSITEVPQNRFYTAIDLINDKTTENEKIGFKKASDGKNINFLIIEKSSVI